MCAVKTVGELSRSGMRAFAEGRVRNADFLLHQALRQARSLHSPVLEAKILNNIGLVAALSGREQQARAILQEALATLERKVRAGALHSVISGNLSSLEPVRIEIAAPA
jgi:hypothetical protein